MFGGIEIAPPTDVLKAYKDAAQQRPKLARTAFQRLARQSRRRVLDKVTEEPGEPGYPLRWKSAKQRRFVMRKLRLENNLPYTRTHLYVKSFKVEYRTTDFDGFLELTNSDPASIFIGGDEQQPFHIDTGWVYVPGVVSDERVVVEDAAIETWFTVDDAFAGVMR
ncbi:MAG: hypothetical protein IPK17_38520 [Chloroflexi bacterium]|uniref:hypothetical protein n=1 Tax=Candidatus Flexifilum breve TaxID=3140694 RepID=UPI0031367B49|nr:hypothetical protein [Chloroflexota bacterium]